MVFGNREKSVDRLFAIRYYSRIVNGIQRLRAYLVAKDMSQGELSRTLSVSPAYISQILSGTRQPSLDMAAKLEDLTGIPARAFASRKVA